VPPHRADRTDGGAGDDPAVAQCVLRLDGGGDHGRPGGGHGADPAVPARAVRGLVPGQARGSPVGARLAGDLRYATTSHTTHRAAVAGETGSCTRERRGRDCRSPSCGRATPRPRIMRGVFAVRPPNRPAAIRSAPAPRATGCGRHAPRIRAGVTTARPAPPAPAPARPP